MENAINTDVLMLLQIRKASLKMKTKNLLLYQVKGLQDSRLNYYDSATHYNISATLLRHLIFFVLLRKTEKTDN